jgi:cellobiose epimerase
MNMENMKETMKDVLENNILNYWIEKVTDDENGGFYGRVDGNDQIHPEAEKGAVMNARILWAFSAAYRVLQKPEYLEAATRAKNYVRDHFLDKEYGGIYWSVDYKGNPLDTKKQTYAIGFAIYGFSEYARATGDKEALDIAISLYHDIEKHAFDAKNNGYIEALTREWEPIADMRLSDKDDSYRCPYFYGYRHLFTIDVVYVCGCSRLSHRAFRNISHRTHLLFRNHESEIWYCHFRFAHRPLPGLGRCQHDYG